MPIIAKLGFAITLLMGGVFAHQFPQGSGPNAAFPRETLYWSEGNLSVCSIASDGECALRIRGAKNRFEIRYDQEAKAVGIHFTSSQAQGLMAYGDKEFDVTFEVGIEIERHWGKRDFQYINEAQPVEFVTHFVGRKEVEQIFSDFKSSHTFIIFENENLVFLRALDGMPEATDKLIQCAKAMH